MFSIIFFIFKYFIIYFIYYFNFNIIIYEIIFFVQSEYYGLIKIGQPAKEFKVIFDTTWSDTWVPSSRCDLIEIVCSKKFIKIKERKIHSYQNPNTLY